MMLVNKRLATPNEELHFVTSKYVNRNSLIKAKQNHPGLGSMGLNFQGQLLTQTFTPEASSLLPPPAREKNKNNLSQPY